MHACSRMLPLLLLIVLLPFAAGAEERVRAYGGRGEDRLLEIAECRGGLFAAGMTMSDDGDLSMRTRTGETGWAMLLDEGGERLWSYTSARAGMTRMAAPAVLDDERCSVLLTDEDGQRCDWILLDASGGVSARMEVSLRDLGMEDGFSVLQMLLCDQEPAKIAVICRRESDGSVSAITLDELGRPDVHGRFLPEGEGMAVSDRHGALAWIGTNAGCMTVTRIETEAESSAVRFAGIDVLAVRDALMQDDGSVVCCGEAQMEAQTVGFAARVSREGEVLFVHRFTRPQCRICQTETGYAVCGAWETGAAAAFLDEDGGLLGEALLADADVLDIAGIPGGCAALTYRAGQKQKQAVITPVYPQAGMLPVLVMAREEPVQTAVSAAEGTPEVPLDSGYLVCGGDEMGVQVTLMDDAGNTVWSTRIPIHTAADALEWRCAARLAAGAVLLGGRYLTGHGGEVRQQGVIALLGSDGVLRRIEEIEGLGAVTAVEVLDEAHALLSGSGERMPSLDTDVQVEIEL